MGAGAGISACMIQLLKISSTCTKHGDTTRRIHTPQGYTPGRITPNKEYTPGRITPHKEYTPGGITPGKEYTPGGITHYRVSRYFSTLVTALAPSATAVTTWRSCLVRTSPAAKTPGTLVAPVSSATM